MSPNFKYNYFDGKHHEHRGQAAVLLEPAVPAEADQPARPRTAERCLPVHADLIIGGSKEVLRAYEQYQRLGTELTLASDLIMLLRSESTLPPTQRKPRRRRPAARAAAACVAAAPSPSASPSATSRNSPTTPPASDPSLSVYPSIISQRTITGRIWLFLGAPAGSAAGNGRAGNGTTPPAATRGRWGSGCGGKGSGGRSGRRFLWRLGRRLGRGAAAS